MTLTLNAVHNAHFEVARATTTGGNLAANAGTDVNFDAAVTTTGGGVTANAGNNINVTGFMTTTGGNVAFRADNDGTGPGGGSVIFSVVDTTPLRGPAPLRSITARTTMRRQWIIRATSR